MAVPSFFSQAMKGDPIELFGGGEQVRDFVYIEDIAKATVLAAEHSNGCEVLNIASGTPRTVREVAEKILELVGSRSQIVSRDIPEQRLALEVQSRFGSTEKAQRLSGYVPGTGLEDGLKRTLAGIRGESAHR